MPKSTKRTFFLIVILTGLALLIALPSLRFLETEVAGHSLRLPLGIPKWSGQLFGQQLSTDLPFKQGLDIQGGMQVVLEADMTGVEDGSRPQALASAQAVILRRVDLFGIAEPLVQTARVGDSYRIIVELPGVVDVTEALKLVGQTAKLEFLLVEPASGSASLASGTLGEEVPLLTATGLGGQQLRRANLSFNPQTGEPEVSLEFNSEGATLFSQVTTAHVGSILGIFLDGAPLTLPVIQTPILDGRAVVTGQFELEQAKQLAIQLNAGALPVPIKVLEQRNIGASLGQEAVRASVYAGLVGLGLVLVFMILLYGWQGVIADLALLVFAILTIALYKIIGVTLTLPGIAGLLLTIGMAVDANILIAERIREEWRRGKPFSLAVEAGFGRAWDSIKDANVITILTALILINPLNFSFLNSSGMVRGFGLTLLIGVLLGLFTGVVVTRNFTRLFLKEPRR